MAFVYQAVASMMFAASLTSTALAGEAPGTPAVGAQSKADEIKLSLFGHRRMPNLYWKIDSSSKGEISAPQGVGYQVASPLIVNPVYRIAPGLHQFNIGEAGYAELRDYLTQIIDGKYDRYGQIGRAHV